MKKIWIGIGIFVVVALAIVFIIIDTKKEPKEIKIGALCPLSGPAAMYGEMMKKGIDLAIEEINLQGGIKGNRIKIIYEDTQLDPKNAVAAFQKLATVEKVPAVIGPMGSTEVLAIAPIVNQRKVVILSPTASAPMITEAGDYIFRNTPSDIYEGAEAAKFAYNKLSLRRLSILFINNDYGIGLKDVFSRTFASMSGIITSMESFEPNSTDFRTHLIKIRQGSPQGMYLIAYKESIHILRQIKELGLKVRVLSVTPFQDPEVIEKTKGAAEGVIYAFVGYNPQSTRKEVNDFNQAFIKKYSIKSDPSAAMSYDAAKLIVLAINKAGYSADEIKQALYQTTNYPGVSGLTSFDKNGDVIKPVEFRIVRKGGFVPYEEASGS